MSGWIQAAMQQNTITSDRGTQFELLYFCHFLKNLRYVPGLWPINILKPLTVPTFGPGLNFLFKSTWPHCGQTNRLGRLGRLGRVEIVLVVACFEPLYTYLIDRICSMNWLLKHSQLSVDLYWKNWSHKTPKFNFPCQYFATTLQSKVQPKIYLTT